LDYKRKRKKEKGGVVMNEIELRRSLKITKEVKEKRLEN